MFALIIAIFNIHADCDKTDAVGCAPGLVCGINNCVHFHEISGATGINDASDCCTNHFDGDCSNLIPHLFTDLIDCNASSVNLSHKNNANDCLHKSTRSPTLVSHMHYIGVSFFSVHNFT